MVLPLLIFPIIAGGAFAVKKIKDSRRKKKAKKALREQLSQQQTPQERPVSSHASDRGPESRRSSFEEAPPPYEPRTGLSSGAPLPAREKALG
ncbi:hypothetical protein MMC28_007345 [Mycoblastus sanguinarius]|nr:hypothetical protein [Mycoblastus sanguinarius]